jgi:hypothetical protein
VKQLFKSLDARDWHAYTGLLLVAAGLVPIYWPLALIVPGAVLAYVGIRRQAQ